MYNSSQYQTIYEDQSRIDLYYRSQSFSANSTHVLPYVVCVFYSVVARIVYSVCIYTG